jgi:uncharacterized protein (TIGR02145 family)
MSSEAKETAKAEESSINGNKVFYLSVFLGWLGIDRFYVQKTSSGVLKLLTVGGGGIWWLIDLIFILTDQFKDASGKAIKMQGNKAIRMAHCIVLLPCFFCLWLLAYGSRSEFSGFTDSRDGKTYKTIKIGTQTWMAENLNYEAKSSECYDNEPANCTKYGRLYYWESAKKVCPEGWHLPSDAEWDKLMRFADGDIGTESPYESKTAGKYLKATSGWDMGALGTSGNGSDKFSFSALPSGSGHGDSSKSGGVFLVAGFRGVGKVCWWWSTSIHRRGIAAGSEQTYSSYLSYGERGSSASVRCIKD